MGFLNRLPARQDGYYTRNRMWKNKGSDTAANRCTLVSPSHMLVNIGGPGKHAYELEAAVELDLNAAASWDSAIPTNYTSAATRAGKDFYIYACEPVSGFSPKIVLSAAVTWPAGYDANNSRKIGRFHCLPYVTAPTWKSAIVTTINYVVQPTTPGATKLLYKCTGRTGDYKTGSTEPTWPTTPGNTIVDGNVTWTCVSNACMNLPVGHPYKDYEMGSIMPNSIQDLLDMPSSVIPEGMVKMSLTPWDGKPEKWVDIYLASGTGESCTSIFGTTIQDTKSWDTFVDYGRLQGKKLLTDSEFQIAATGSNEQTNIAESTDPVFVTFPLDTTGMSMISYYGCIGMCGVMYQWLDEQCYRFDPDGSVSVATKTMTAYHVSSPGGNPIYIKFMNNGEPYLCCNMAIDAADKWLTFGTDYKILIKHDVNANTGSQIYFNESATQPNRILANLARGKSTFVASNNPTFALQITHSTDASTLGKEINYDDGNDERLEFNSSNQTDGTIDLALLGSAAFGWRNMFSKGSRFGQGIYGDIKLRAGGNYTNGWNCGSRCRYIYNSPWNSNYDIGGRFCAESV